MSRPGRRIRVVHANLFDRQRDEFPWRFHCDWCAGGSDFLTQFSTFCGGPGRLGGAKSWQHAQAFAVQHAAAHLAEQCPTCKHIPDQPPAANPEPSPSAGASSFTEDE